METWDAIRSRRNVRSYRTDPVPAADLDRIAEAAWRAPSASNRQHWDFIIVTDPDRLRSAPSPHRQAEPPPDRPGHPPRRVVATTAWQQVIPATSIAMLRMAIVSRIAK